MGIKSGLKSFFKPHVAVNTWVDYSSIKARASYIKNAAKNIFTIQRPDPSREETFEQATQRLHLTETDIQQRIKTFKALSIIFVSLSLIVFIYLLYSLFISAWIASVGSLGIFAVLLGQAFRYNFWLYQTRERKLGCTFQEWFNNLVGRKK